MSNLVQRVISAIIALGILAVVYSYGTQGLFFLCTIATVLCFLEFTQLLPFGNLGSPLFTPFLFKAYFVLLGTLTYLIAAKSSEFLFTALPLSYALLAAPVLWFWSKKENLPAMLPFLGMSLTGLVYCGLFPAISYQLISTPNGPKLFLTHLAVVFGGDIAAYFAGLSLGKNKLHEALSPKKTVEGSIGGLAGSILFGYASFYALGLGLSLWPHLLMFVLTGVFAQVGDLFKSFFKRHANVKDSGFIMPGHGGILDRIDGVLFSSSVYFVFCSLFLKP